MLGLYSAVFILAAVVIHLLKENKDLKKMNDKLFNHLNTFDSIEDNTSPYEIMKEQREKMFNERIENMKNELALEHSKIEEEEKNTADILDQAIYNLPYSTIPYDGDTNNIVEISK